MSSILDLEVFVRTADTGSLSAAARSLGLSPAAASIALKRLETRLGSRLLARSTRSMRLTEEGRRYLDSVREALATLAEGEQALRQQSHGLTGLLQLAAPSDFGRNVVLGWLDAFKLEHPNIRLQLMLNDSNADLFRETVDIALRFGVPRNSSLVALPVVHDHRRIPCASPDYLARHGTPRTPTELAQHNTLRYMRQGRANNTWYFRQGAVLQEVEVTGDPSSKLTFHGLHPESIAAGLARNPGIVATATHCVSAIPAACGAAPGIKSYLDLPLVTGRAAPELARASGD